jgi:hypothetical protein
MKISTILPGSSYSSGVFSISFSSINSILTTSITPLDSFETLLFGLCEALYQRQKDGFITQPTCSCEVSNRAYQSSVWEETTGVFSSADILSHLVSFDLDVSASFSGNTIHPNAS